MILHHDEHINRFLFRLKDYCQDLNSTNKIHRAGLVYLCIRNIGEENFPHLITTGSLISVQTRVVPTVFYLSFNYFEFL